MFDRTSGVLLPVASLPGPFGCGVFGAEAVEFAKKIARAGFHVWQVLPLGEQGGGNSPYSSPSAFAGSPWYIDPRGLADMGLLTGEEVHSAIYPGDPYNVNYAFLKETRLPLLETAFSRADKKLMEEVEAFAAENPWVEPYARFSVLRRRNGDKPCWQWTKRAAAKKDKDFYAFLQYIFHKQWFALKAEINALGVSLMGDIPIYVSHNSADFYAAPENFQTDAKGQLTSVAGVPPDAFSADGQLWGNPLYDWDAMEKDGYSWWIERMRHTLCLFDAVRIDHFRGFESYFSIPADAETAKAGSWKKGPGMKLFTAVKNALGDIPVVAEDLGIITDDVRAFLSECGFPGMRVFQFGFDGDPENLHLPHAYAVNSIAFTGTHDNDTTLGWLYSLPEETRREVLDYAGFRGDDWGNGGAYSASVRSILRCVWQSVSSIVMAPAQDLCGYGSDTRVNVPGTAEGNWSWRLTREALESIDVEFFAAMNLRYGRGNPLRMRVETKA